MKFYLNTFCHKDAQNNFGQWTGGSDVNNAFCHTVITLLYSRKIIENNFLGGTIIKQFWKLKNLWKKLITNRTMPMMHLKTYTMGVVHQVVLMVNVSFVVTFTAQKQYFYVYSTMILTNQKNIKPCCCKVNHETINRVKVHSIFPSIFSSNIMSFGFHN